jgi:hypothetical protein
VLVSLHALAPGGRMSCGGLLLIAWMMPGGVTAWFV